METIKTSTFEKLKIRPVNVCDLKMDSNWFNMWVDLNKMKWRDLVAGDVLKTECKPTKVTPNIWIAFDLVDMKRLFGARYSHTCGGLVRINVKPRIRASYSLLSQYYSSWSKFSTSTPTGFDVVIVWKTGFDISNIFTYEDFFEFYKEHNLFDLCKY